MYKFDRTRKTKMKTFLVTTILAVACLVTAEANTYTVTDLGDLAYGSSQATGINQFGDVVGVVYNVNDANGLSHAFVCIHGTRARDIGKPGVESWAYGINNNREVVGANLVGVTWHNGIAINNLGAVTGDINVSPIVRVGDQFVSTHAFLYRNGVTIDLGPNTRHGVAINNAGQVVGDSAPFQAFVYTNGRVEVISGVAGEFYPIAINDHGQIAANTIPPDPNGQAFLYANGILKSLGSPVLYPLTPQREQSEKPHAEGINNSGEIVGRFTVPFLSGEVPGGAVYYGPEAFIYVPGVGSKPITVTKWVIVDAAAINDGGQIAATGYRVGGPVTNHALLLTPVK
jgi:uncharacterized membrane protein